MQYSTNKKKIQHVQDDKYVHLNCSVQRSTGKLVVVLGVDYYLHDIVSVTLKHLAT